MWDIGGVYIYIHNYHGYPLITHLLFGILMAWRLLNPDSILFVSISNERNVIQLRPKAKSFQLALWTLTTFQTLGTNLWEASNETQKVFAAAPWFFSEIMWGSLLGALSLVPQIRIAHFVQKVFFDEKELGKSKRSIFFGIKLFNPKLVGCNFKGHIEPVGPSLWTLGPRLCRVGTGPRRTLIRHWRRLGVSKHCSCRAMRKQPVRN